MTELSVPAYVVTPVEILCMNMCGLPPDRIS